MSAALLAAQHMRHVARNRRPDDAKSGLGARVASADVRTEHMRERVAKRENMASSLEAKMESK